MVAALAADQRSLQPILDSNTGAAENRGRTQKEIFILKTPETDNLARGNHVVPTEWAEQLERERDEALIDRANGDIATMTINHYERVLRERDEAREKYDNLATEHMLAINKLCNERDEARNAIPDGEWVAYEDYHKIHDAASRLLVVINKQLPIGCFTLISSEYYRLQNAICGREETITDAIKRWNASTKK